MKISDFFINPRCCTFCDVMCKVIQFGVRVVTFSISSHEQTQ